MKRDAIGSFFCIGGLRVRASAGVGEDSVESGETGADCSAGRGSADNCGSSVDTGTLVASLVDAKGGPVAPVLPMQILGVRDEETIGGFALGALGSTRYVFPCTMGGRMRVVYRAFRNFTSFFAFWNSDLG